MRIFRADVDEALGGPGGDAGDRHAFDQHEGIAFHDHAVGEGGAVALVGVADDVFALGRRIEHRLPLDAGREARAAAAAQAGFGDLLDDVGGRHGDRVLQALEAAQRLVGVERQRVVDAAAREGQARLLGQERDLVRRAQPALVMAALEEAAVEQALHVGWLHGSVGDSAIRRRHLDHRFQEIGAARAVAHDLGFDAALLEFLLDRPGDLLGAERQRAGIGGDIDARDHERTSATISSIFSSSSRPITSPSSIAEGEQAQSPRQ